MGITRPTGEQLRFRSAATGDHILDTYMENSEKGSRTLPDLMDDLFDSSGVFRSANFEFRFDATTDKIQFRAGNFSNSNTGWTDITTFFNITGTFSASTTYNNFDLLTLTNKDVYIVHGLSSGTTFADEAAVIASANTDKIVDVSEARDWAKKTDGIVDSTDYSSKAWAIGGTGVTNGANKGAAKEWATKTGSTVDGSDYSAKHWATTGTVATVSSGIANINTVAAAIANVNTTATNISNVNTVAGISANVTTVAGIAANVTTVATNNANVTAVATNNSNINSLATNMADINTVADEIDNNKLQTVADNINAVVTAADDLNESTSEIEVVANNIANVNAVGGAISNVNTVAGIAANVTTVAGISANTTTVAGIAANVTTVAGIAADVTTAAANTAAFNNLYLGAQSSAPTQDPDGSALDVGDLYFDTTSNTMKVYAQSGWTAAGSSVNGTSDRQTYTATAGQTVFSATYDAGYVDVYLNGVKLLVGTDFTATNGTSVTLASGAAVNDIVDIVAYGTFVLSDHYTKTQSDARYVQPTHTGNVNITGTVTADGLTVDGNVGIGTSSPSRLAELYGTSNPALRLNNGTDVADIGLASSAGALLTGSTSGALVLARGGANAINLGTNGQNRVTISSAGNVGIGASPSTRLTVGAGVGSEEIRVDAGAGWADLTLNSNATNGGHIYFNDGSNAGEIFYYHPSDYMAFNTAGTERMRLDASGAVIAKRPRSNTAGDAAIVVAPSDTTVSYGFRLDQTNNNFNFDRVNTGTNIMSLTHDYHVLVGTTDSQPPTNNDASGIALRADGKVAASRSNGISGDFNNGSNGDILWFRKAGTVVGGISTWNDHIGLFQGGTRLEIDDGNDCIFFTNNSVGGARDNTTSIGKSNARIKDLYLSGGVYLGGTGAANKISDYETGTWTPAFATSGINVGYSGQSGNYTKIGREVFVNFQINLNSVTSQGSGNVFISGLPFTFASGANYGRYNIQTYNINVSGSAFQMFAYASGGTTLGILYSYDNATWSGASTSNFSLSSNSIIAGSFHYVAS